MVPSDETGWTTWRSVDSKRLCRQKNIFLKNTVFRNVTPCNLVDYRYYAFPRFVYVDVNSALGSLLRDHGSSISDVSGIQVILIFVVDFDPEN
jgi:hypothetical protein